MSDERAKVMQQLQDVSLALKASMGVHANKIAKNGSVRDLQKLESLMCSFGLEVIMLAGEVERKEVKV